MFNYHPDFWGPRKQRVAGIEAGVRRGLAQLQEVDLPAELRRRALTLQGAPRKLRGTLRYALRTGLSTALDAREPAVAASGWKLFFLAPRMLLHRAAGQNSVPASELEQRCAYFRQGEWLQLLRAATGTRPAGQTRTAATAEHVRSARAVHLVQLGELSAAAHALTAAPQAPGNADTLAELRDPDCRPQAPQVPLSAAVLSHQPDTACPLPESVFLGCLRGARRGSAAGPCGATNEHLRLLLDEPADSALLHRAAERLANADVPEQVLAAVRLGRMVALRKPNGRVRALVVGDVFRRLVARALAQHFAAAFQEACLPYQFGLSTRAGTEGLYKLLHTATALDARATVLSIDAVGAFDHVSRQAMLEGLRSRPALAPLLPFARQFYGSASVYTWLDETGAEHDVTQGDGGEQGDPLMPALFSLAQHPALSEAAAGLQEGEAIFAFLDDNYVVSAPERTDALHSALEDALWRHARIRLNRGKTRVWNAGGEEPAGLARLQPVGAEPVWTGAWSLPADQQGLLVLGAPLGSEAFVRRELRRKRETQDQLLARLPAVGDLQCAWLLLLFCASPRPNYLLRMLPPGATEAFAREHDAAVCACLAALLSQDSLPTQALPQPTQRLVHLPLRFGGLGVRSAVDAAPAAYWASWADCLPTIRARAPLAADRLVRALQSSTETVPPLTAARHAAACLREQG